MNKKADTIQSRLDSIDTSVLSEKDAGLIVEATNHIDKLEEKNATLTRLLGEYNEQIVAMEIKGENAARLRQNRNK